MRSGELCKSCTRAKCEHEPTQDRPMLAPCPKCDEVGCDECDGKGYFEVPKCPKEYVGHRVSHAANLLSYVNKGLLPDSGGVLDQSAWMVAAWNAIESDCAKIEEERRRRS